VAVVDAFGQPVKITEEQYAKMDPVDREDIKKWEKEVLEGCESSDPEQKRKSEWLRDNVMGKWIFLWTAIPGLYYI
jgi:transposase-like protein